MAVGDVISATYVDGGATTFVPAAGIEIMVTAGLGRNTSVSFGISDGTITAYSDYDENTSIGGRNAGNIKLGITNTYYVYFNGNSGNVGFTGIQIK
jgi:hypothetical protein|tara:strand:+ start:546 stop:833 length:288 start_codon:yes stop_codon:yes gene_type:complete